MTDPAEQRPVKLADALLAGGCFVFLVGAVVLFFVKANAFFNPRRPASFAPPVRETRTPDEERVRERLETTAHSAVFTTTRRPSEETPPEREAPEPRPGVSLYTLCNRTSGTRVLYLDGVDIFSVDVPSSGSVTVEVRSGDYDLMVMGKVGETPPGEAPVVVVPIYRRARFEGVYHTVISDVELPPGFRCGATAHSVTARKVP